MIPSLAISSLSILLISGLLLISLGISIIALIDILRSNFKGANDKLIWVLIVLFLGFFGALLYFLMGSGQKASGSSPQ